MLQRKKVLIYSIKIVAPVLLAKIDTSANQHISKSTNHEIPIPFYSPVVG